MSNTGCSTTNPHSDTAHHRNAQEDYRPGIEYAEVGGRCVRVRVGVEHKNGRRMVVYHRAATEKEVGRGIDWD